jgi:hypothetical protein
VSHPRPSLERRVAAAAAIALAREGSVSPIDVLTGMGWLPWGRVADWRQGRIDHLEQLAGVHPDKLAMVLEHLRAWAADAGLEPSDVAYLAATRDRRPLRFTADGDPTAERAYRTHWDPTCRPRRGSA